MSQPVVEYVRALDCFKSPDNVRTHSDAAADAELEANIASTGHLLQNLIGVRAPRSSKLGKYAVYGGGRRLERVLAHIANGVFGEDFMVPILLAKSARHAIEMSLAENYYQLPMNPADECCGFKAIIERENKSPADVAKRFGLTEKYVLGRLRLANLAEPVFMALRSGEIGIEVAKAYGSTADTSRQASVFELLQASPHLARNLNEIRRQLASGAYRGSDPKALLVGRDAYLAAGGRIDSDLFSDCSNESWLDGELVERLAEEALATAADAIRQREGFAEVRVLSASYLPWSVTSQLSEIEPEPLDSGEEVAVRQSEIRAELDTIEADAGDDEYSEEQVGRIEALNTELEALEPQLGYTPAQKAGAIAYVLIGEDGNAKLHDSFFHAEPENSGEDDVDAEVDIDGVEHGTASDDDGPDDDEVKSDHGTSGRSFSGRLRDELAMMKTELLAVHVASDPQFALDLGVFIMVDAAPGFGWSGMPSELRAKPATPRVQGFESDTPAAQSWIEFEKGLDATWREHESIEDRYDAFCDLDDAGRAAWLGYAVARTIHAVPDGQTGSSFLNRLGAKLEIDVARWWRPTARNFFDRLNKSTTLDLLQEVCGPDFKARYANARKFDLAASAERLFAGDVIADDKVKERAIAWVPSEMRFSQPDAVSVHPNGVETLSPDDEAFEQVDILSDAPDRVSDLDGGTGDPHSDLELSKAA
ncbi:ParB/RepB/Spo0J family partition protein [Sphingomonas sp. OTU376]|uniref:ParB/RepB/Spo0J family partition protein n=1 Tax=Sphingomonas sp. OTU376 TaxID=3043863 RepID=UPI00313CF8EB